MLLDPMGGIVITNDGNCILREVTSHLNHEECVNDAGMMLPYPCYTLGSNTRTLVVMSFRLFIRCILGEVTQYLSC